MAGALPLSMALSSQRLRLISSLGVGVLVGTSLIVIIPEGIGAAAAPSEASHIHRARSVAARSPWALGADVRSVMPSVPTVRVSAPIDADGQLAPGRPRGRAPLLGRGAAEEDEVEHDHENEHEHEHGHENENEKEPEHEHDDNGHHGHDDDVDHAEFPAFEIGVSLILGFVLMFLIDRIPRHATDRLQAAPQTHHISLDSLTSGRGGAASGVPAGDASSVDEEADGLLGSLAPPPRRARPLATTLGLVIHAAADGIAMGASATAPDTKMSFVIFLAIMIHKAPAAFGLTSLLLRQGLSKRAARGHLVVFSLAAPVGSLATWTLVTLAGAGASEPGGSGTYWTGMLMLFSGGTFL